jgi:MFS family permease
MIGTSPIFSLPDSTKVIFMGLCLLGFSATMVVIPMFPEMLHSIEEALPHLKGDELNNVSAGFFNSCLGVGEALGPISASILTHALGFRSAEDILGTLILIYCITYFLLNGKLKMFALKISSDKVKDDDFVPADANGIVEGSTGDRKVIRKNSDVDQIGLEPTQRLSASASGGLPRAFNLIQSLS